MEVKTRNDVLASRSPGKYAAVLFYVSSFPQSQQMQSVLSLLQEDHKDKLETFRVDATDVATVRTAWGDMDLSKLPLVVLFKPGGQTEEAGRVDGANPPALVSLIERYVVAGTKEQQHASTTTSSSEENNAMAAARSEEEALRERLTRLVQSHEVVLFMKGKKAEPFCRFSKAAVAILNQLRADFRTVDVFEDEAVRQGIKQYSDWPTFPQLYIKGQFIGGVDIIDQLFRSGELTELLKDAIPTSLDDRLAMLIHSDTVMVFMKGSPSNPFCRFSRELMHLFSLCGITDFGAFDILQDQEVREGLKAYSQWPTYPQVYVEGKLLGGVDIVKQLIEQGGGPQGLLQEIQTMMAITNKN